MAINLARWAIYDKQHQFISSDAGLRGFCAGRGSGKTTIGAIDLCYRAKAGRRYMCVAPNYTVMSDATMREFENVARELGVLKGRMDRDWETA